MEVSNVSKFPVQLRVIHRRWPLGHFVQLPRGAEGDYGWMKEVRALLVSGGEGEERGRVLLAAFVDKRPLRCPLKDDQCVKVPSAMYPEDVLAARAWRTGVSPMNCGLYLSMFPGYDRTQFLVRTGISRLYYAHSKDEKSPPTRELSIFETHHVEVIRVTV